MGKATPSFYPPSQGGQCLTIQQNLFLFLAILAIDFVLKYLYYLLFTIKIMIKDLTRDILQELYLKMTNKELCKYLKITQPTLSKYLDFHKIKRKERFLSGAGVKKFNLIKNDKNSNQ